MRSGERSSCAPARAQLLVRLSRFFFLGHEYHSRLMWSQPRWVFLQNRGMTVLAIPGMCLDYAMGAYCLHHDTCMIEIMQYA